MNKVQEFYKTGKTVEDQFAYLLMKTHGGIARHSSRHQDMFEHIDIIWSIDDKTYTFDVKGLKKHNQTDTYTDDSIHWVELQNVRGNLGWVYGKADYIVFETNNDWLFVKRKALLDLLEDKVRDKTITNSKELYTYYQRYNRQDIVVKVLTNDLRKIANSILNK